MTAAAVEGVLVLGRTDSGEMSTSIVAEEAARKRFVVGTVAETPRAM